MKIILTILFALASLNVFAASPSMQQSTNIANNAVVRGLGSNNVFTASNRFAGPLVITNIAELKFGTNNDVNPGAERAEVVLYVIDTVNAHIDIGVSNTLNPEEPITVIGGNNYALSAQNVSIIGQGNIVQGGSPLLGDDNYMFSDAIDANYFLVGNGNRVYESKQSGIVGSGNIFATNTECFAIGTFHAITNGLRRGVIGHAITNLFDYNFEIGSHETNKTSLCSTGAVFRVPMFGNVTAVANDTKAAFKSTGTTNSMVLVAPNGGQWILTVGNSGALAVVTNVNGL